MDKRSPETPFHYFTHEKNNSPQKTFSLGFTHE